MTKVLTWKKENGDWGLPGVDLGALPTPLYAALYRLQQLEHDGETPWRSVDEPPELTLGDCQPYPCSRRLILCNADGDSCLGFCEHRRTHLAWVKFNPVVEGEITHWMELPTPPVSELDTGKGVGGC